MKSSNGPVAFCTARPGCHGLQLVPPEQVKRFPRNVLALFSLRAFILYLPRFQISLEEGVLASLFARDYAEYCHGAEMPLEDRELAPKADDEESMEYMIGVGLAVVVCAFATLVGFDRDRVFYPMLVTVIATYYILFAVIGSSTRALALESLIAAAFLALAVAGFKKNLWLIVAALPGHGVFDFFHRLFIQNPGVPVWWPGFCLSFDVLAGGFLAMLLMRRSGFASKV